MLKNEIVKHILETSKDRIGTTKVDEVVSPNHDNDMGQRTGQYIYKDKIIHRPFSSWEYDIQDEKYDYSKKLDSSLISIKSLNKVKEIIDNDEIDTYYTRKERDQ